MPRKGSGFGKGLFGKGLSIPLGLPARVGVSVLVTKSYQLCW